MISKMHPKWHCTIKSYTALIKCLVRLQNTTTIGHGVDPHTKYHAQSVFLGQGCSLILRKHVKISIFKRNTNIGLIFIEIA